MISRGKLVKAKKRMQPKRGYVCKFCGGNDHYAMGCFKRPNKPIPVESATHLAQRRRTRRAWFAANPPDENGQWTCYLQIAPDCPKKVDKDTIDLEHVKSKGGHPKLRYKILNIKAACQPCNKLKRSWSVEVLAETYPQVAAMIATPEWQEYNSQLIALEASQDV